METRIMEPIGLAAGLAPAVVTAMLVCRAARAAGLPVGYRVTTGLLVSPAV